MTDLDDPALLREYAAHNSEAAFAELVSRRVGFVYSAALRQVRDPHLAGEITQAVFIILAQKAARISDKTVLTGWLFKTTRFAALAQIRDRARQTARMAIIEKEFQMQNQFQAAANDEIWNQMSPLLDEALARLGEKDRQAVLLRFFENKSLAEVGNKLGTGEDTARKRVARALEKLRKYFSKRGVVSTAAIIAGAISANSVQAAPALLAKTVTAAAIVKGSIAAASTLTLVNGALKLMAWSKVKFTITTGTLILLAATTGCVVLNICKTYVASPPIHEGFNFEDGVLSWKAQTYPGSEACSAVSISSEQAKDGQYSLKMSLNLIGGDVHNSAGEAWAYLNPASQPENLTGRTITAWIYAPVAAGSEEGNPSSWQLFVKDDQWHSEYGSLSNIVEGQWTQLSLTVGLGKPDTGSVDQQFDSSRVWVVGVRVLAGGAPAKYEGPVYVDDVRW